MGNPQGSPTVRISLPHVSFLISLSCLLDLPLCFFYHPYIFPPITMPVATYFSNKAAPILHLIHTSRHPSSPSLRYSCESRCVSTLSKHFYHEVSARFSIVEDTFYPDFSISLITLDSCIGWS
jgi:hypothetical protein